MIRGTLEPNLNALPEFAPRRHGGNDSAGQEAPLAVKSNKKLAATAAPFVRAAESFTALYEPLSEAATRAGLVGLLRQRSLPSPGPH